VDLIKQLRKWHVRSFWCECLQHFWLIVTESLVEHMARGTICWYSMIFHFKLNLVMIRVYNEKSVDLKW